MKMKLVLSVTLVTMFLFSVSVFAANLQECNESAGIPDKNGDFSIDLGPVSGAIPKVMKQMSGAAGKSAPLVIIYQSGYKSYSAPDSVTFACWEPFDSYHTRGNPVYFGVVVANYEATTSRVQLEWDVIGPTKSFKIKQNKAIGPHRVMAYFIRRGLPGEDEGTYGLATSLYSAGTMFFTNSSFFYVSKVY